MLGDQFYVELISIGVDSCEPMITPLDDEIRVES